LQIDSLNIIATNLNHNAWSGALPTLIAAVIGVISVLLAVWITYELTKKQTNRNEFKALQNDVLKHSEWLNSLESDKEELTKRFKEKFESEREYLQEQLEIRDVNISEIKKAVQEVRDLISNSNAQLNSTLTTFLLNITKTISDLNESNLKKISDQFGQCPNHNKQRI
jgi:DNA anti-recombination protein RmuC